jgi:Fic family protein
MSPVIFTTPAPNEVDLRVLKMIDELREELQFRVSEPRRWSGSLRRLTFARAVQGSNSIEGYNATLDDVVAAVEGEPIVDADTETALAVAGYRDAMTYVLQHAQDPGGRVDEGLLKALHFMMIKHDLSKNPGRWRPGAIWVRRDPTGEIVYEGPPAELIPSLIDATLAELEREDVPELFRAAMAHLNLVMVHPFSDGNGRMARALQTLVLAREQIISPVFSSIEEYLGRNTQAYYEVLGQVGGSHWSPQIDARPWVRYCLTAHYRQARTHLRRVQEVEDLWVASMGLAGQHGLAERAAAGVMESAYGLRLTNSRYRSAVETSAGEEISELTATRDLKAMVDAELLMPIGERRGRYYVAAPILTEIRQGVRERRPPRDSEDPFERAAAQLALPI